MENSVTIKGNKNGIIVILNADIPFDELKNAVAEKFSDAAKLFGVCKTAVSFEGRALTDGQALELIDIIQANSQIEIICLIDNNEERSRDFEEAIDKKLKSNEVNTARFYKGNLRSGQSIEFETSVIVLGDVNPGAIVTSKGNIIVLGTLRGIAVAGQGGNRNAFVIALDMCPSQIRIDDVIARSPDSPDKDSDTANKIAFLEKGNIYIETLDREILNEIKLS